MNGQQISIDANAVIDELLQQVKQQALQIALLQAQIKQQQNGVMEAAGTAKPDKKL